MARQSGAYGLTRSAYPRTVDSQQADRLEGGAAFEVNRVVIKGDQFL
ncbi:MAG: hypothetical protein OXF56_12965 [Rhodobacteraceae bacterium]|nr:hypothetical protein [Paracoccaceae bacterium]